MTGGFTTTCPEPQILAAFVEGTLDDATHAAVARHVGDCVQCPVVIGNANAFLREEKRYRHRRTVRKLAVAASVAAMIPVGVWQHVASQPIRHLRATIEASGDRRVEGQLASAAWAPFNERRSAAPALDVQLQAAAARVLRKPPRNTAQWHDRAIALLAIGRADEAVDALRTALHASPDDPLYWNDLAVALLATNRDLSALEAADRALAIAPSFAAAHFNRGLALQRLGRRREAMDAYRRAQPDAAPEWRTEIRARIARLLMTK